MERWRRHDFRRGPGSSAAPVSRDGIDAAPGGRRAPRPTRSTYSPGLERAGRGGAPARKRPARPRGTGLTRPLATVTFRSRPSASPSRSKPSFQASPMTATPPILADNPHGGGCRVCQASSRRRNCQAQVAPRARIRTAARLAASIGVRLGFRRARRLRLAARRSPPAPRPAPVSRRGAVAARNGSTPGIRVGGAPPGTPGRFNAHGKSYGTGRRASRSSSSPAK